MPKGSRKSHTKRFEKQQRLIHLLPAVLFVFGFTMRGMETASAVAEVVSTTDFQVRTGALVSTNSVVCVMTPPAGVKCAGTGNRNGSGTGVDSTSGGDVQGLTSGVKSIAVGSQTVCAVTTAGGAKCWGVNNVSASASPTSSTSPVDVVGLTSGVEQISIGSGYTCFLTTTRNVQCVGLNNWGQLGNGGVATSTTATSVSNIDGLALSISSGAQSSCIVTTTRTVKCWGYGGNGALGNGSSPTYSAVPVDVSSLSSVSELAVADGSACALTTDGAVKCWGRNDVGQLGSGVAGNSNAPVDVIGLSSGVRAIRAGQLHYCAILDTGSMKCWGRNSEGQLGTGATSGNRNTPIASAIATGTIVDVSAYLYFTCVLNSEGVVRCFGTHPILTLSTTAANVISGLTSEHIGVRTLTSDKQVLMRSWYPARFNYGQVNSRVNLGIRATTTDGITISSIFFAKGADNTGSHTGLVWDSSGQVLAQEDFTNETETGWQKVVLSQPVYIAANSSFTVGYSVENFGYPIGTYFPSTTVGPIAIDSGYYVYSNDVTTFPAGTVSTNYGIDFEFIDDSSIPTTTTTTTTTLPPTTTTSSTSTTTTTTTTLPPTTTSSTSTTTTTTSSTSTTTTTTLPPTTTTSSTTTTTPTATTAPPVVAALAVLGIKETSTKTEVVAAIANVIKDGVTSSAATSLASNAQVLESIKPDQATEVFEAIAVTELSAEEESELVAAVTDAPTEIKATFESTIDVYADGLDEYVAVGSNIDVGSRKSLIAATAAIASVAAAGGSGGGSSGNSSGPDSSPQIRASRREDE